MKVVAHPLVVAAALGLLGPEALSAFENPETRRERAGCAGCAPAPSEEEPSDLGLLGQVDETLFTVEAPSAEDIARVANEWKSLS